MKKPLIFVLLFNCTLTFANTDSILSKIKWSAYIESYLSLDDSRLLADKIPGFVNHSTLNSVQLNLALLQANYTNDNIRTNLGLMTGTYSQRNYQGKDEPYRSIYELSLGIKLSKTQNIWIDAGIFPSHLGAETPIGLDNWALTRSFQAEASPYYEAGAKISYTSKNEKWYAAFLLLNGWQMIQQNYKTPISFGHHVQYKPNSKLILNSGSYIGFYNYSNFYTNALTRYFHNFYMQYDFQKRISLLIGFDYGIQNTYNFRDTYYMWYSPQYLIRIALKENNHITLRYDYLNDFYRIVFNSNNYGFIGKSYSINYDLDFYRKMHFRIEGKWIKSTKEHFQYQESRSNENYSITAALIYRY